MAALPFPSRVAGRTLRACLALLAPLLLVTCTDNPVGPGRPGIGRLRIAPVFNAYSRIAPLTLDNVQVIVVRQTGRQFPDTVAQVSRGFSASSPQLQLDLPVLLSGLSDTLDVTLRLFAGTTLLFEGTRTLTVTAGPGALPDSVPVLYLGPGASVASLTLSPRDTTLQTGDSLAFLLNAADSQQAPVAQYYVSWSLVGATARGVKLDAAGTLRAPSAPDLFYVKVATPNGTVDSTSVTIVPRAKPGVVTWTGAVDTQWTTAGNWNTGALPSAVDSVVIPTATRNPTLTAAASAGAVNVTGGTLVLNGFTLTVARTFATSGTGTLTMTNQSDLLDVKGNARFNGGSTAGLLIAGLLKVGGSFTQLGGGSPQSYAADPQHATELDAPLPVISFATPGLSASHFGTLIQGFNGTGFRFATDIAVSGYISSQNDGFFGSLSGSNVALTIPSISSIRFDGVRLIVDDTSSAGFGGVFAVQFTNLPTSATQITIRNPGSAASSYTIGSTTFMPLAAGNTGKYVSAIDVDGATPAPLLVYIDFDANNNGPAFSQASGGAQVFWPSSPFVWTGATSSDWATSTNWNTLRTPFSNSVVIPSGTPNSPQFLSFGATVTGMTIQPGASLDVGANTLTVNGNLDNDGAINGTTGGQVISTGNLRGQINVSMLSFGSTLTGNLTLGPAGTMQVGGPFDLAGHTANIPSDFFVSGTGDIRMTSAGGTDSLLVGGNAIFAGASTAGLLTTGVLKVVGNFSTSGFSATEYAPSGTHKTILGGTKPITVTLPSFSGAPSGRFKILDVSAAVAGISLLSPATHVDSLLISTPSTGTPVILGGGDSLFARRVQVTRLTVDQVPITIDELGVILPQQFDNVTFQNDTTSTLLNLIFVGTALAPRTVTFNTTTVSFNGSNLYVQLTSSNGQGVTVVINGSNNPTGGPSRSNPPFGNTVAGARILWQ